MRGLVNWLIVTEASFRLLKVGGFPVSQERGLAASQNGQKESDKTEQIHGGRIKSVAAT